MPPLSKAQLPQVVLWVAKQYLNAPTPPASVAFPQLFIDDQGGIADLQIEVNKFASLLWGPGTVVPVLASPTPAPVL